MAIVFPYRHIILDACSVINLHASGKMDEILKSLQANVFLADYVYSQELVKSDKQIYLQSLVDSELLHLVSLNSENEENMFVNLAAYIDDGEAITSAIAVGRNWAIGTDDKSAVSFFRRQKLGLQVASTLELIKHWVDTASLSTDMINSVLDKVRREGVYEPGQSHPFYTWWQTYIK